MKIFDPFFSTKDKSEGTGLGLSMAYNIIEAHNGFIDVKSSLGVGTSFEIYLPVFEDTESVGDTIVKKEEIVLGTGRILIVDDEVMMRDIATGILQECGYSVMVAKNGKEAVDLYAKDGDNIDAVLLDSVMPVLSGKDATVQILKINPEAKVMITSGFNLDINSENYRVGAKMFLQKPYTMARLSNAMHKLLSGDYS